MPYIPASIKGVAVERRSTEGDNSETTTWIIIGVIIGVLVVLSVVFLFRMKRSSAKKARDSERSRSAPLGRGEFARVRKLSNVKQMEEQETQRAIMIRKSLATRSTTSSMSSIMSRYSNIPHRGEDEEDIELDDDRPRGLRDDWKEFEARINRERSSSGEIHPCITDREDTTPSHSRTVSSESFGYGPYTRAQPSPIIIPPQYPLHPPPGLHPALASMEPTIIERVSPYDIEGLQPMRPARVARV
ncbi:Transcription initiation protein [Zalerion maritima]|uniref:Transcription initiation protein n=1 Tax=Zalerion maritima TaxID=339359 RepID=A0AAD5WSK2_9PEZI|nr:Transcription initiation protein [Zalerion maritima]